MAADPVAAAAAPPGIRSSGRAAAALDVAVTDAAAVRAAMCVAPPTPSPTLQPIALTLDF